MPVWCHGTSHSISDSVLMHAQVRHSWNKCMFPVGCIPLPDSSLTELHQQHKLFGREKVNVHKSYKNRPWCELIGKKKKKSALPVHSQKYTYTEIKNVSFACPLTKRYLLGNKKFSFACSLTKQIQLYICRKLTEQMLPLCEHVILIKQCQRQKYFARQCINFLTGSQK